MVTGRRVGIVARSVLTGEVYPIDERSEKPGSLGALRLVHALRFVA